MRVIGPPHGCAKSLDLGSLFRLAYAVDAEAAHQLIPELIPVFVTWQTTFSGNKIRHCRQIGELAYRWLTELEQAHHPRARRDRIEPFGGALNRRDVEKSLRALFTSSVGDVPEMGSEYLQQKLAERESLHLFRGEILTNSGAFIRHLPADLVDFVLGAFLEEAGRTH